MPNDCVLVQVKCKYKRGHTGRRKEEMIFPPVKLHISLFTVNNDKVALWCKRAGFHFLLTSKLWAFNPRWKCQALRMLPQLFFRVQCLGRLQQIWKKKKEKKRKREEMTSALLFSGSALVFLKVCGWCWQSPLSVNVTGAAAGGVRRMANEDDHEPVLWLGRCY